MTHECKASDSARERYGVTIVLVGVAWSGTGARSSRDTGPVWRLVTRGCVGPEVWICPWCGGAL